MTLTPDTADDIQPLRPLPAAGLRAPTSVSVLGFPLSLVDYEGTLDWVDAAIADGLQAYLCVANVHTVMESREDDELRRAVLGAALNVPDGQPLVWALRALGHNLDTRVYGPELMARACARGAHQGRKMYLYGGRNQGALVQLALNLRRQYEGLQIVGGYAPPFRDLDDEEQAAVVEDINRSGAEIVWIGIGVPKQEKWMAAMRGRLHAPVLIGVGAAFDFHAGLVRQAPSWMQHTGLEWVFRLAQEPRRLWRRYARYNPLFLAAFGREWVAQRREDSAG
jgi:N-acetylglucosaminyldiphosphoundecaprenol N-acetyl-beta-D-mannosaminyltransferase